MTVDDLIEALEQFPGDLRVGVRDAYWGTFQPVTEARIWRDVPPASERVELIL